MHRVIIVICVLLVALSLPKTGVSQVRSIGVPYIQNYSKATYTAGNQNWSVTKDENGIMYFGNGKGLLSYDGHFWQLYKLPNHLIIRAVAADGKGRIYTGAFGELGYWSRHRAGLLTYISLNYLLPKGYEFKEEIWKIYAEKDRVIFQTFGAIYIYKNGKFSIIKQHDPYIFLSKAGNRYFISPANGNGFYELKDQQLVPINTNVVLGQILSVLPFGGNQYIICTAKNGLFVYDGSQIRIWKNEANEFLKRYQLNNAVNISHGLIACGTILNGIIIIDSTGTVVQHLNKSSGLQNNTVLTLYTDMSSNLWAGLDNGIDRIEVDSPLSYFFDKEGIVGTVYSSLIYGKNIYLGTNQGLFYSAWPSLHANRLHQSFDFKLIPGSQGQVWNLSVIDGQLLCGHNDGTFIVENNNFKAISTISGGWIIKKFNPTTLIQGTYTGLVIYQKSIAGKWIFHHKIGGFGEPVRYVEPDGPNDVWVSHAYKGIYHLTLSPDLKTAIKIKYYGKNSGLPDDYNINVFNLNGRIVFSSSTGFYSYDEINDRFVRFEQLNRNLGNFDDADKIISAGNRQFWLISKGRIALADFTVSGKVALSTRQLSSLNGRMVQYYENISHINSEQYLISIDDGFAIFNTATQNPLPPLPAVAIRNVEYLSSNSVYLPLRSPEEINISHAQNSIRVNYSLPFFRQVKIQYQYLLQGYSQKWSEWNVSNQTEFSGLGGGEYIFKVRAKVDDKYISKTAITRFTILPPWYLNTYAWLSYICLIIGIIYIIRKWLQFKINRHQVQVQEKLKMEHRQQLERETAMNEQQLIHLKNLQLERDLERKGRELANSTMSIVFKNELLQKINAELIGLKTDAGKLQDDQLKRIRAVIDEAMNDQRDWNLFEESFNETHENFFKKLKAIYPDLVPNDLKLCAYLRMNMSSKEMASLLNITLRGIEIKRYRLRKKLNIDHQKNLVEFLMEL